MAKYNSANEFNSAIGDYVRKAEGDFTTGLTHHSKYVDVSLFEDINKVYAYLESKHTSGPTDSKGREKPFFNIVLAARNIWYRATDIDRKNIKLRSTKIDDDIAVFLATVHFQEWMRKVNFGQFLNLWGINSAGFNESVLKFIEQDGDLIPSVVPWNRIICDSIDFKNNPKIEILDMTEAQLRGRKGYDQDMVDQLCTTLSTRETVDGEEKDNKSDYIRVYEVHGLFPKSYITKNEKDDDTYVQQMHIVSFVKGHAEHSEDYDDFTLFSGREVKDPYMLTALLPEVDGSIALRGAVKNLFDAQWMQNHTMKAIKDQLDLTSKIVMQTSDGTFAGQNVLKAIENGDILIHKQNEPLTQVNLTRSDSITSLENFGRAWKQIGNELDGLSDAMLGIPAKSGTAWRQVEALLNENHSLFETMTENRGFAIEEMCRQFIFPYLKKKMDTSKEIAATLAAHDIERLDERFIKNVSIQKSNAAVKEMLLSGVAVNREEQAAITDTFAQDAQARLKEQGNVRYFKPSDIPDATWKQLFKDMGWEPEVDTTGENVDKEAATTLQAILTFFQAKNGQPLTPEERFIFNKLLQLTGTVSPIEIASLPQSQPSKKLPPTKMSESINYKDAPPSVQRQMEAQAGLVPATEMQPNTPVPGAPVPPAGVQ